MDNKPPLGLKPRWIVEEERLTEVKTAIYRYMNKNLPIPSEWYEEYLELVNKVSR